MANELDIYGFFIPPFHEAWPGGTGEGTLTAGTYYAHDSVGPQPHEAPPMYQDLEITFPGVDGIAIKRFGFRGRLIHCRIMFVGATKGDAESRKNSFNAQVTRLASFAIKVPGGTNRPYCRLLPGSGQSGTWEQVGGFLVLSVDYVFKQVREA